MSRELDDWARRYQDLQAEQTVKRSASALLKMDFKELRAIRNKAVELWGTRANIYAEANAPGIVNVGYFEDDDRRRPPWLRRQVIVARGATLAEILEQLALVERSPAR